MCEGSTGFRNGEDGGDMTTARAAVLTAANTFELREFDVVAPDDGAVISVDACGLCGTDLDVVRGDVPLRYPVIPGHEIVGTISSITDAYARATSLAIGDRVVIPGELHCGTCRGCLADESCLASPGTHGFLPTTLAPSLWGGFADAMALDARTRPLRIDRAVPIERASLFNLLGAGWSWAVEAPQLEAGQSIVVLGPGQRGLACVLAASEIRARVVAVTGLGERDRHKLDLARRFGAELALDATDDVVGAVLAATDGGVDVVVDTTPHSTESIVQALAMVRPGGVVVVAGLKGRTTPEFPTDTLALRRITMRGVRAVTRSGFRSAIAMLERGDDRLDALHTHHFDVAEAMTAIETLRDDSGAIAVSIGPLTQDRGR